MIQSWLSSLKGRLLLVGVAGILLFSLAVSWLLGGLFEQSARNAMDRRLQGDLHALLARSTISADGELTVSRLPGAQRYQRVFSGYYWQIFDTRGRALEQSYSLWDETIPWVPAFKQDAVSGFDFQGPLQQPLRGMALTARLSRDAARMTFVVAEDRNDIGVDANAFRRHTALALAILAALWFAMLAYQVQYGMRPLRQLEQTAVRVRRGEDARFPDTGLLKEVAPLASHLNELLDHHARMAARARSSAEDLAHALKTPLAILGALRSEDGEHGQQILQEQVMRMRMSIDRHLSAGMLADSRQRTPVAATADALVAVMRRLHADRNLCFDSRPCGPEIFAGSREDLEEMLGNLLDNAGKWARRSVVVTSGVHAGGLVIEVSDDGPGLPPEQLQCVLLRGVRLDQRDSSTGLGLAIVGDIAASYGGRLTLSNAAIGLRATLELPAAG